MAAAYSSRAGETKEGVKSTGLEARSQSGELRERERRRRVIEICICEMPARLSWLATHALASLRVSEPGPSHAMPGTPVNRQGGRLRRPSAGPGGHGQAGSGGSAATGASLLAGRCPWRHVIERCDGHALGIDPVPPARAGSVRGQGAPNSQAERRAQSALTHRLTRGVMTGLWTSMALCDYEGSGYR